MPAPGSDDPTLPLSQSPTVLGPPAARVPRVMPAHLARGAVISRYRIESVLGEGGMGVVYLARQDKPDREVALKVVRPGYATEKMLRRFEHESEVLGRLLHPGIAQIYEAGTADAGLGPQPFFAMELVKGVSLTRYAAEKKLSTRARLELLAKVCDAVQHAHQKGVIHRDLKPGNILVVEEVTQGPSDEVTKPEKSRAGSSFVTPSLRHSVTSTSAQPKILDFGVARATDSDIQQTTMQTDVGAIVGTIPYMSPEQVGGNPDELDTRSDVYALGVIAYELLVGRLPYDLERKMIHEAARIIKEDEPTRLSSIDRTLRGDVETIVGHALEKDKSRRYSAASALAADIRRYLGDEPIAARPASTWYQLAKFSRRNRALVAGVAATFAVLVAGLSVSLYAFARATRAEKAESAQRITAETAAQFMSDTLQGASPYVALGRDTTILKEMMNGAARRIDSGELKHAPAAELRLRTTIGTTYQELSELASAERLLEPAVALARRLHGERSDEYVTGVCNLAAVRIIGGRPAEGAALLESVRGIADGLYPGDHATMANLLTGLALAFEALGRSAEAEPLLERALAMRERLTPGDNRLVAISANSLGWVRLSLGRPADAEPLLQRALEMRRRLHPGDHPDVAISLSNVASVREHLGRAAEAEGLHEEALAMRRRLYPFDHASVAWSLNNLAIVRERLGRAGEAEPLYREALAIRKRLYPGGHPEVAFSTGGIASALIRLGRHKEALPLLLESTEMLRRFFPEGHPELAMSLNNLAIINNAMGDYPGAEAALTDALEISRRFRKGDHPEVARFLNNLGAMRHSLGRYDEARGALEDAVAMRKRIYAGDHPDIAVSLQTTGAICEAQGRFEEADSAFGEALAMLERLYGADHPDIAVVLESAATLRMKRGDAAGALELHRRALDMRRRLFPGDHPDVAESLLDTAGVHLLLGRADLAAPLARESLQMLERLFPGGHAQTATAMSVLGSACVSLGDVEEAQTLLRASLEMSQRLRPGGILVAEAHHRLAQLHARSGRLAEAVEQHTLAADMLRGLIPPSHPNRAMSVHNLAVVLDKLGRFEEAEPLYAEALEMRRANLDPSHRDVLGSMWGLAVVRDALGRHREAQEVWRPLVERRRAALAPGHWQIAYVESMLANSLIGAADAPQAAAEADRIALLREAETLLLNAFESLSNNAETPRSPEDVLAATCAKVVRLYSAWDQLQPGQGRGTSAVEWKSRLDSLRAGAMPASPGSQADGQGK